MSSRGVDVDKDWGRMYERTENLLILQDFDPYENQAILMWQ